MPLSQGKAATTLRKSPDSWDFSNSFVPVLEEYPAVQNLLELFSLHNADFSSVSGSGSAVFGVFTSKKRANRCYQDVKKVCKKTWHVNLLDRCPVAY